MSSGADKYKPSRNSFVRQKHVSVKISPVTLDVCTANPLYAYATCVQLAGIFAKAVSVNKIKLIAKQISEKNGCSQSQLKFNRKFLLFLRLGNFYEIYNNSLIITNNKS